MGCKLSSLPIAKPSMIRHVRVSAQAFRYWFHSSLALALPFTLRLPPGSQVDTFTILSGTGAAMAYRIIDDLIQWSDDWKEMRFVSENLGAARLSTPAFFESMAAGLREA
ncbi:hypothetical protein DL770_000688 [Monosporascus sp. CRB-9-2]|nr:hypothetical protein DL770_000688 [Monosporascus sp. CRB-9-2]